MAFSENLKSRVRKRAHFHCCLCHSLGIEVHHIVPESEGGPDTEDNAAPLCPSCHETYGANPQKRKFIREARDFWYELCDSRFGASLGYLQGIAQQVEHTASKDDLQRAVDKLTSLIVKEKSGETIAIGLPEKYWVMVLFALERQIDISLAQIDRMRADGFDLEAVSKLSPEETTALIGPVIARSMIVDVLVEKGMMTREAGEKLGTGVIQRIVDSFLDEHGDRFPRNNESQP